MSANNLKNLSKSRMAKVEEVVTESSDSLNQTAIAPEETIAASRRVKTFGQRVALIVATCGVGHIPLAPGTWGSLLGVGIYAAVRVLSLQTSLLAPSRGWTDLQLQAWQTTIELVVLIALVGIGVWAATKAEPLLGRKDPGAVVIDEVAGQLVTFLFVPYTLPLWMIPVGFVLFRGFDIWKPYPIRRIESLESGLGVMADDLIAGVYAGTVMSLILSIYLLM